MIFSDKDRFDISILILTHNRPKYFERCIESVLNAIKTARTNYNIEILVNNDSCDIREVCANNIRYFYETNDNLSVLYKHLFDNSQGQFIYYLEDDDYMLPHFFDEIDLNYSWNFLNFKLHEIKEAIAESRKEFKIPDTNTHFQLSQLFFKKECIMNFPDGNNLHNDWELLEQLRAYECRLVPKYMYVQTKDAGDNISDIQLNKDRRWPILNNLVPDTKFNVYTYIGT